MKRKSNYNIEDIFINRWSPRSLTGEIISNEELMKLFEAARWAPSSFNNQPWRFIYAKKDTKEWKKLFELLSENNKIWCKKASHLILVISKKTFDYNEKYDKTHSLSTGSAWQNLALQATEDNIVTHGMAGFDYDRARTEFNISDKFDIEMMIAIGKQGKKEALPKNLEEDEEPSTRKKLSKIIFDLNSIKDTDKLNIQ